MVEHSHKITIFVLKFNYMTVAEKKIQMVQRLLLLEDKAILFEIDKLIAQAFKSGQKDQGSQALSDEKMPVNFEAWVTQFEDTESNETEDEFGMTAVTLRQRIWAAEQSAEMSLDDFWKQVAQN